MMVKRFSFSFLGFILSLNVYGFIWYVDTTGYEAESLQTAIDNANAHAASNGVIDTVLLAPGIYHLGNINASVGIVMRDSVVLMGVDRDSCIISGISEDGTDSSYHVIYFYAYSGGTLRKEARVVGLTIMDGWARDVYGGRWGNGGGIYIYNFSPTIENCKIVNNYAEYYGGGIYIWGDCSPVIKNCRITNNRANRVGGGIHLGTYSNVELTGSKLDSNYATSGGGGMNVYFVGGGLFKNDTFCFNEANTLGGGGIRFRGISDSVGVVVESCYIHDNKTTGSHGAGIRADSSYLTIIGCSIYSNTSENHIGGGIYANDLQDSTGSFEILYCNIYNNDARNGGGIGFSYSIGISVIGNRIENNQVDSLGGGIFVYGYTSPTIKGNIIENNSAGIAGGGIFVYNHASPEIDSNYIRDNTASYYGGGLYIDNYSNPVISGNEIIGNSSYLYGGAMFIQFNSYPELSFNKIYGNTTFLNGGGILVYQDAGLNSFLDVFRNNSANSGGGGLCLNLRAEAYLNRCLFEGNNGGSGGGAIVVSDSSLVTASYSTFVRNKGNKGGAFGDTTHSALIIRNSLILDNGSTLDVNSGVLYVSTDADTDSTVVLENCNLYFNTYQKDVEILNNSSDSILLQNNYWWTVDSQTVESLVIGPAYIFPIDTSFVVGVPGEPEKVDSVRAFSDSLYETCVDSIGEECILYLSLFGKDRNSGLMDAAGLLVKSSIYPEGIVVGLVESDTSSGFFTGQLEVAESGVGDDIRSDDIQNRIRVDSSGDTIRIVSLLDSTKYWIVGYKLNPTGIQEKHTNGVLWVEKDRILFQLKKSGIVSLELLDVVGRVVKEIYKGYKNKGLHSVKWNRENLHTGLFFIKLTTSEETKVIKYVSMQ